MLTGGTSCSKRDNGRPLTFHQPPSAKEHKAAPKLQKGKERKERPSSPKQKHQRRKQIQGKACIFIASHKGRYPSDATVQQVNHK